MGLDLEEVKNKKKVRSLFVQFEQEIPQYKISAFRGAIIEKVGREHLLFHQHNKGGKLIYRYPLIQYKRIHNQASIFCLGEGVGEIHKLFGLNTWEIDLKGKPIQLTVDQLELNSFDFKHIAKKLNYKLENWVGLNARNYQAYQNASGLRAQLEILEKVLVGNILSMAKGIDWHIEQRVEVVIQDIKQVKSITLKGTPLLSFDLEFQTNVNLPNYIGLGKSVSHGFGTIYKQKK